MMVITLFKEVFTVISNVHGKKINKENDKEDGPSKWDLVDLEKGETGRWLNIYFFPRPFFRVYKYPFTYTKLKKVGEEKPDDFAGRIICFCPNRSF